MAKYLTLDEVMAIHDVLLKKYGGNPGVFDQDRLESAVDLPQSHFFGEEQYPTISEKAAAYFYFLNKNHGFNDGNKRVGVAASLVFLLKNSHFLNPRMMATGRVMEKLARDVADNKCNQERLFKWFRRRIIFIDGDSSEYLKRLI